MIDLDKYCARCGEDRFTEKRHEGEPDILFCTLCWKPQLRLASDLRKQLAGAQALIEACDGITWKKVTREQVEAIEAALGALK